MITVNLHTKTIGYPVGMSFNVLYGKCLELWEKHPLLIGTAFPMLEEKCRSPAGQAIPMHRQFYTDDQKQWNVKRYAEVVVRQMVRY